MSEVWPFDDGRDKPFVALSIGHNEHDGGAVRKYGGQVIVEFDYAQKIVEYIVNQFQGWGISTDMLWVPKTNHLHRGELAKTIEFINQHKVDFALELHFNSAANKERRGGEVFYCKGSVKGEKLAQFFAGRLSHWLGPCVAKNDTQTWTHHLYGSGLGFTRKTHMPAILLEPCFLSNDADLDVLISTWQELGNTLALAILDALRKFWGGYNSFDRP